MSNQGRPFHLVRNAIANWILFGFVAIVSFFLSPFVVQYLGATGYGVWSLLAALVGYLGLLDFGIRNAVNRYIAHHRAAKAHEESSSIVSAAIALFGCFGVLAIVLSMVLAYVAPFFFNIPDDLISDSRIVIVIGGITLAASLIGGVFGGVVTGLERFDVNCYLEILVTAVRTAATVVVLQEGYGLVALAFVQLGATAVYGATFWVATTRLYPELRVRPGEGLRPHVKTLVTFGSPLFVIYCFGMLITYSDAVVIAAFLPIEAVAFYAIAGNLSLQARGVASSLANVMTPRVSALLSSGGKGVGEEILGVARIATLAIAPIAFTFIIRGKSFIDIWMGTEYGRVSGEVLSVLAVVLWLGASRIVVIQSLMGMSLQRTLVPALGLEAMANLGLSILLVKPFGILGVALGTLIPSLAVNLGFFPYCLSKATGVQVRRYVLVALILPTIASIPFAIAMAAFEQWFPARNLLVFFIQVALALPMVALVGWHICLTPVERQKVRAKLRALF